MKEGGRRRRRKRRRRRGGGGRVGRESGVSPVACVCPVKRIDGIGAEMWFIIVVRRHTVPNNAYV